MARVKLNFDDQVFIFETVMRVRSTDIGFGQQVRPESMIEMFSEARARFLYAQGLREIDSNYYGILVTDLVTQYLSRVRAREELLFEVGVTDVNQYGGDIAVKVSRMYDTTPVARGKFGFVYYNYIKNEVAPLNDELRELFIENPDHHLVL